MSSVPKSDLPRPLLTSMSVREIAAYVSLDPANMTDAAVELRARGTNLDGESKLHAASLIAEPVQLRGFIEQLRRDALALESKLCILASLITEP